MYCWCLFGSLYYLNVGRCCLVCVFLWCYLLRFKICKCVCLMFWGVIGIGVWWYKFDCFRFGDWMFVWFVWWWVCWFILNYWFWICVVVGWWWMDYNGRSVCWNVSLYVVGVSWCDGGFWFIDGCLFIGSDFLWVVDGMVVVWGVDLVEVV